jgi:CspA family cold shock protein
MAKGKGTPAAPAERFTGTVRWFNDARGYGFIAPDDTATIKKDVFVHFSSIDGMSGRKTLEENDRVEFEVVQGAKGPQAAHCTLLP